MVLIWALILLTIKKNKTKAWGKVWHCEMSTAYSKSSFIFLANFLPWKPDTQCEKINDRWVCCLERLRESQREKEEDHKEIFTELEVKRNIFCKEPFWRKRLTLRPSLLTWLSLSRAHYYLWATGNWNRHPVGLQLIWYTVWSTVYSIWGTGAICHKGYIFLETIQL